jgi:hypothetical protein
LAALLSKLHGPNKGGLAPFAQGLNALMPPLDVLKDPQVHFWLKLAQPTLSMLLSMPSHWILSLASLENVMGPWCSWANPQQLGVFQIKHKLIF